MKKIFVLISCTILTLSISAQRYAYIDSEYILENIPEYKTAQQELNDLSITWEKEIDTKFTEFGRLNKKYQADKILLTDEMRVKREQEISSKEEEVKALQKKRFGVNGDLFKKRTELIKPIQDKIFNAIKKMAFEGSYAFVFDKANSATLIYTDPKYDKSDKILKNLGYK